MKTNAQAGRKRSIFLVLSGLIILFCLYKYIAVDRMGFCYQRLWFVSSDELILDTIGGLMKARRIERTETDTSPQAFLSNHPKCCRVNWGEQGVLARGLMYFGSAEVTVIYEMTESERKRHGAPPGTFYEFVANDTACGETVGYTGITTTAPK